MTDTIRTKAELLALLADNTTGDITPQDIRDMLVSLMGVYGGIKIVDGITAQSGITPTPETLTGWEVNSPSNGVSPDYSTGQITVDHDGVYLVTAQVSFSGTLNTTFTVHVRIDGVEQDEGLHRKMGTGGDVGSASLMAIISLSEGNVLTLYVQSDAGGGASMTPVDAQFMITRIG